MGKIQLKTFVLVLDRPQAVYRAGEIVNGSCFIDLNGEMSLSQLHIKLVGAAEVKWTETETRRHSQAGQVGKAGGDRHTEHVVYHATHPCVELSYYPGSVYQSVLTAGQHNVGFTFQLPVGDLPSSYEGAHGHVRYWLEAKIHKPEILSIDHSTTLALTLISPARATLQELGAPVTKTNQKTIGIFSSGNAVLRASLNHAGLTIGGAVSLSCSADNNSKKPMSLRATLKQVITFHARGKHKQTVEKLVRVLGSNSIAPFSSEVLSLLVPNNVPVLHGLCPIIQVKHIIKVTLDIPGSFDLHCELPVIVTSHTLPFDYN